MQRAFIYVFLILTTMQSWAKTVPATYESMENLMVDIRDPFFESVLRKKYLQLVQTQMQQKIAQELKTTPDQLKNFFIADPKRLDLLWAPGWIELQTEFYTTLHQETFKERWLTKTKEKKVTDYGKNITEAMLFHLKKYSGVKEGLLYNRWNEVTSTKQGKKATFRIPFFAFTKDTKSLLALDAHTPYEKILAKEKSSTPGNPSLSTFLRGAGEKTREQYQLLAEKIQLNHRIYIRAVANGAKTIASVHYLTGEHTLTQTESKVSAFIEGFCDGCSRKEKEDYKSSAISYVIKTKKTFNNKYGSGKDVVNSFCTDLKNNLYQFDPPEEKTPTISGYRDVYIAVQDNTRVDRSHIYAQMQMIKIEAIRKTIQEHDLGVLFLTNALTRLSEKREPFATYLDCTPESLPRDMASFNRAITEATHNVEKYIANINQKIKDSTTSLKMANETLEYFTQTNVAATAEAIMTFPQGIGHTVDSILELDHDVKRRKRIDKIVTWGGTIIGVALTVSGIGAPEGVALLLTLGAMAKGAISGSYYLYRAQQEKEFYNELMKSKIGLGNNFYLGQNLQQHYTNYRYLRLNYIVDFAGAFLSFAQLNKMALIKTSGNVPQAHSLIERCMRILKASGEDVVQGQVVEAVINTAIH